MDKVESAEYYSHSRPEMMKYIPAGCGKILEVGCGEGLFGRQLKKSAGVEVWGVELIAESAQIANHYLDKVLAGDFESCLPSLPVGYFDCIVFNDVLEHFTYPDRVLTDCRHLLKEGGYIVSSIPNVRYIGNLKELLFKKDWQYRKEGGILDYTHFRFFTKKSIARLFAGAGYKIKIIEGLPVKMKWAFYLINTIFLFQLSDTKYAQFAVVAQLEGNDSR